MQRRLGRIVGYKSRFACCVAALLRLTFTAITAVTVARTTFAAFRCFAFVARGLSVFGLGFLCGTFWGLHVVAFWALGVGLATLATFTTTFAAFTTAFSSALCSSFAAFVTTVCTFATRCAFAQSVVRNVHRDRLGVLGLAGHGFAAFTRRALWAVSTPFSLTLTLAIGAAAFARGAGFTRLASFPRFCRCAFCALVAFA